MLTQILIKTPRYRSNTSTHSHCLKPRELHKPLDRQFLVVLDEESYNMETLEEPLGIVI